MRGKRPLKDREIKLILGLAQPRETVICLLGLTYGLRLHEINSLRFRDFAGEFLSIKSSKGSDNISFPINDQVKGAIEELRGFYDLKGMQVEDNALILLSLKGKGRPISDRMVMILIKNLSEMLRLENVGIHSFRKTFITRIYRESKFDLITTRNYSRHKSLGNLIHYIETTQSVDMVMGLAWG